MGKTHMQKVQYTTMWKYIDMPVIEAEWRCLAMPGLQVGGFLEGMVLN